MEIRERERKEGMRATKDVAQTREELREAVLHQCLYTFTNFHHFVPSADVGAISLRHRDFWGLFETVVGVLII